MNKLTEKEKQDLLNAAQAQNQQIAGKGDSESDKVLGNTTSYTDFVKPGNVIGTIEINKINVNLPIYEGSTDEILEKGVGHLETSSMPVGGESTHAILTGHRGLPTSKLFTDLDKLEKGDTFKVTVFDNTITYKIDQIIVVDPSDVSELQIVEGKDYCTLITCTPYMINTHRLLVRGIRIENLDEETGVFDAETNKYYPDGNTYDEVLPLCFIFIIIVSALTVISCLKYLIKERILKSKIKKLKKKLAEYEKQGIIAKTKKNPIANIMMPNIELIPVNTKERIKIYDLPILEVSSSCEDIIIHDPKIIKIITDKGLERIKIETTKIDNTKTIQVTKESTFDIQKIKIERNKTKIDKSKQASSNNKVKFIRNATITATVITAVSCLLLKNKKDED